MNSNEETQLADDLRHITQGRPPVPDLDAIEHRGRREQQRAFAFRGLAALCVVGVAVAGTLVAFHHTSTTGGTPVAGASTATKAASASKTASAAPQLETIAYVRQQIDAAQFPADSVVAARQRQSGDTAVVIWTDPATGDTYSSEGSGYDKTASWEHDYFDRNRVLHWDQTGINYGPRTWYNLNEHAAGPISGPVPKGPISGDYTPATLIKGIVDHGDARIVGHPVVDGQHTVELSASFEGMKWLFYVDSQIYLVVRQVKFFPGTPVTTLTDDYTWVKRTAALTNLINHPQIPAGFTQVPPPN